MSDLEDLANGVGADARQARRTIKRRAAGSARGGSDDFAPLVDTLGDLADRIAPAERKKLGNAIATDLRDANARRERANVEPDGEDMVPRKRKPNGQLRSRRMRDGPRTPKRSIRQSRMFQRAATAKFLRKESSTGEAQVGFVGAMARIMRVHQYGLRDTVTRDPASPAVTYPARVVLGMNPDDRLRILDRIAGQIQP